MKKYFYSHIVETQSITVQLSEMDLTEQEKSHLISLVEGSIHHAILDTILSELSEEDKKQFLHHAAHDRHDKIWNLLNDKAENIEDKIKKVAEEIKKQLHKDIQDARKLNE